MTKKIKKELPQPISPQYNSWTTTANPFYQNMTSACNTLTIDGYDNITIRDLIYKINEICNYLNSKKEKK